MQGDCLTVDVKVLSLLREHKPVQLSRRVLIVIYWTIKNSVGPP